MALENRDMNQGDCGLFRTCHGSDIEGEIIGTVGTDIYEIRTKWGFVRMLNRKEIDEFLPLAKNRFIPI